MNAKLQEALQTYDGPLSPEQIQTLRDMQGWMEYGIANGLSMKSILTALAHDANGIIAEMPFFRPEVTGYARYRDEVEDLSAMAGEPDPNLE